MITPTVRVYWLITALYRASISFCLGYYVLFLKQQGLSDAQIMLPNMCYWFVNCIADTPTGALADRFGRKMSFVVACGLMAAGTGVYALSSTLWFFLVAETILAIGSTCESGAFDAWFNTHYRAELNDDALYNESLHRIYTKNDLISNVCSACASILGAMSSLWGGHTPYVLCSVFFTVTGLCALLLMRKDKEHRSSMHAQQPRGLGTLARLRLALRTYRSSPALVSYTLFGFILVISMQAPNMYWAITLKPHLPTHLFGFGWLAIVVACSTGLWLASNISQRRGPAYGLVSKGAFTLVCLVAAGLSSSIGIVIVTFLLHEFGRGMFGATRQVLVCMSISKEHEAQQATLLSIDSTIMNLAAGFGLLIGWALAHTYSPQVIWALVSGVLLVVLLMCSPRIRRVTA